MPRFFAVTSKGLEDCLEREIHALGIHKTQKEPAGVVFEGNWKACYKANLYLRTATRVLLTVLDFEAYNGDELYNNIFKKHDFTKYGPVDGTLAVHATVKDSMLRDQRLVAMKIKDAVVDQFRNLYGRRPSVDTKNPTFAIHAKVHNNSCSISIDTSGDTLQKRGYRVKNVDTPLKEHIAAGLLYLSGWDHKSPIVDPMCGSGTFLIEAALMALNTAPGLVRKSFPFQHFSSFNQEVWDQVVEEAISVEKTELPFLFYGFDSNGQAVKSAIANVQAAGLSEFIIIKKAAIDVFEPPCENGTIVVNPPYGERVGDPEVLKDSYRDLSYALKRHFVGWNCWILAGNKDLLDALKLKSSRRFRVFNGQLECRFLQYSVH